MSDRILIGTSIAPGGRIEVQRRAVDSWRDLNFDVASYNHPMEIEQLSDLFPDVTFEPTVRTGQLWSGKPVIFISDILRALKASRRGICGIINSDILITRNDQFVDGVRALAKDGFVYGPRVDVDNIDQLDSQLDLFGADFFFFNPVVIDSIPESHVCIGMPYWDHWLPLMALLAGHPTTKLVCPFARHVRHVTSRDDSFFLFADEFVQQVVAKMTSLPRSDSGVPFFIPDALAKYRKLKSIAMEAQAQQIDEKSIVAAVDALARFIDEISRYVVTYLERNVKHTNLG